MRLSRRALIENLLIASAVSALPARVAGAARSIHPAVAVVDKTLTGSADMSAAFNRMQSEVYLFEGDPGALWMHRLEPGLRRQPIVIAGYTSAPTLFCLQYLARDYGLELTADINRAASFDANPASRLDLLDLRDPQLRNQLAASTWLLAPQRG
jgi:hypothetical protein